MITKDETVNIWGLMPEMQQVLKYAQQFFDKVEKEFVITSARDGIHSAGSYHYYGYAVDFRTRDLTPNEVQDLYLWMKSKLSIDYDVVVHSTHMHVEYDYFRAMTDG